MIVSSLRHFFRFVFESRLDVKSSLLTYDFAEKEKENKQIKKKTKNKNNSADSFDRSVQNDILNFENRH